MIATISTTVLSVATILVVILALAIAASAVRMIVGPGYADRFIALDMLTGVAVAACALTSIVTQRREFLDVGVGVALIAFVATTAFAAFLEKKERDAS